jgi:hypothetical protein
MNALRIRRLTSTSVEEVYTSAKSRGFLDHPSPQLLDLGLKLGPEEPRAILSI